MSIANSGMRPGHLEDGPFAGGMIEIVDDAPEILLVPSKRISSTVWGNGSRRAPVYRYRMFFANKSKVYYRFEGNEPEMDR